MWNNSSFSTLGQREFPPRQKTGAGARSPTPAPIRSRAKYRPGCGNIQHIIITRTRQIATDFAAARQKSAVLGKYSERGKAFLPFWTWPDTLFPCRSAGRLHLRGTGGIIGQPSERVTLAGAHAPAAQLDSTTASQGRAATTTCHRSIR